MNTLGIFVIISLVLIFIAIIFLILQKYFSKDSHQELWFQLLELIQTAVQKNMADVREQISNSLKQHAELLTKQIHAAN